MSAAQVSRPNVPEPSFDDLYREVILEHYHEPHGKHPVERRDVVAEGLNPLCGDELDLVVQLGEAGRIEKLQVDGRGCAISVASGSILHDLVEGVTPGEAHALLAAVRETMHGGGLPDGIDLGDFDALEGVKLFPVRIKCALLPWTTLEEALRDIAKREAPGTGAGEVT